MFRTIRDEWPEVKRAKWSFFSLLALFMGLTWGAAMWFASTKMDAAQLEISSLKMELVKAQNPPQNNSALHRRVTEVVDRLSEMITTIEGEKRTLIAIATMGVIGGANTEEKKHFEANYRFVAKVLRQRIVERMPAGSGSIPACYEAPFQTKTLRCIASDLRGLAKALPPD